MGSAFSSTRWNVGSPADRLGIRIYAERAENRGEQILFVERPAIGINAIRVGAATTTPRLRPHPVIIRLQALG